MLEANQTDGTATIPGPKQPAFRHHLLLKPAIRLLLLGAMGGSLGIGVFHALFGLYHLWPRQLVRGLFRATTTFVHVRLVEMVV